MDMASPISERKDASTAWEREQQKSSHAKAQDIAYTINHALACTALDTLNTPVEVLSQRYLGRKFSISFCPGCATNSHAPEFHGKADSALTSTGRWLVAEYAGDWLGVIPTVTMQRYAPGVMEGIGRTLSYVLGPVFRYGANRSAGAWALEQGISPEGETAKFRANEIYQHELKHLPQAAVWTVASTALCLGTLRLMGDTHSLGVNAASKLIGASTSILGVLGTRAMAPDLARNWDSWPSRNLYLPLTKVVGRTIGIEEKDVDVMAAKDREYESGVRWQAMVEAEKAKGVQRGLGVGV